MKRSDAKKGLETYMRKVGYYSGFSGELYIPTEVILSMVENLGMSPPDDYDYDHCDCGNARSLEWEPEDD